jgi:hypothetical protein
MRNLLYLIAVLLIIGWLVGIIGYALGGLIHILLVLAIISIIIAALQGDKI